MQGALARPRCSRLRGARSESAQRVVHDEGIEVLDDTRRHSPASYEYSELKVLVERIACEIGAAYKRDLLVRDDSFCMQARTTGPLILGPLVELHPVTERRERIGSGPAVPSSVFALESRRFGPSASRARDGGC
jgi:hypothetical protein